MVKRYQLSERVKFLGQVQDIEQVLCDHHMLVLPSRSEGMPLALIEAFLCYRPAIGTAIPGIPELIQEGKTGFLAKFPTVQAVDEALDCAWHERHRWQEMGLTAGRWIRTVIPRDLCETFARELLEIAEGKESLLPLISANRG